MLYLILIIGKKRDCCPPARFLFKVLRAVELKEFYFIADLHQIDRLRMNKDGFTQISMHPHITYSDTRYLLCSTFFPHTKLAKTHSVDFHPRLYILFSVRCQRLQSRSDGAFMLAVKRQGATLRVSLGLRTPGAALPGLVTIQRKIN